MPRTITIADQRLRTRRIILDLSDPERYVVTVCRERVEENASTGEIVSRATAINFEEVVAFEADGRPVGSPELLNLLAPIQAAVEALEVAHLAKLNADVAASAEAAATTGKFA